MVVWFVGKLISFVLRMGSPPLQHLGGRAVADRPLEGERACSRRMARDRCGDARALRRRGPWRLDARTLGHVGILDPKAARYQ